MVDMFTNYQNLSEYYIPNNLSKYNDTPKSYTKLTSAEITKPYELYNAYGELEGYTWHYGQSIVLDFAIEGEFSIYSTDIVLTTPNQTPSSQTEGRIGSKAYNVVDMKSWTCVGYIKDNYVWELDQEFTYRLDGTNNVYIDASDYIKDKTILFNLYNFRNEVIYSKALPGSTNIKIEIDSELSKALVKGIYSCSLAILGKTTLEPVFALSDCKLLVK